MLPRLLVIAAVLLFWPSSFAYAQDVFLARVTVDPSGRRVVETPVNITNRPGYDNQPSFGPDAGSVLYTSTREDQQADIYNYDIATRVTTRLTRTAPESEYSALLMPSGDRFSVIRVERDSTQRLWSFALDGSDPQVVIPDVKPVGYHAWAGTAHIALFVLGSPNSLQLFDTRTGRADTITTAIGRSLAMLPVPGAMGRNTQPHGVFSFVKREGATFTLYTASTSDPTRTPRAVAALPQGSEYVAWLSASQVITGQDNRLMLLDVNAGGAWTEFADLSRAGLSSISRLAIGSGPSGQWIALVAEPVAR